MLPELKNVFSNQETLDKQIFKVLVKGEKSALFSNKRGYKGRRIKSKGDRQK